MDTLPSLRSHAAASSPPPGSDDSALGQFLRRARESRGLTLEQVSNETKIPKRHLDALEHGNLSAVPSGIYQRAEIRAFAKSVGVDQNLALAQFERALEASSHPTGPATQSPSDAFRPQSLAIIGVVSLAIAAISVVAMLTHTPEPLASRQPIFVAPFPTDAGAREALPVLKKAPRIVTPAVPEEVGLPLSEIETTELASGSVSGQLVITTEPRGARVTVNGVGWGVTPVTIQHLSFGDHRVRVTKAGYASEEHVLPLSDEVPARTINIQLSVQE